MKRVLAVLLLVNDDLYLCDKVDGENHIAEDFFSNISPVVKEPLRS